MDPWTTLQIAASILQFVDVGCQIVSAAKEVYESADGVKKEIAELKLLVEDIQSQNAQIVNSRSLSKDETALKALTQDCVELSKKLEKILAKLTVRKDAQFRILESTRVSIEAVRKSKDIVEVKRRLLELQSHVQQRLAIILQSKQNSELSSVLLELKGENNKRFNQVLEELEHMTQSQQDHVHGQHQFLSDMSSRISVAIEEGKQASRNQQIIASLWFKVLKDREDKVEKAYDKTIGWLFDQTATTFCNWLENDNGIYWINGLAGSGKSTLMKFAARHDKTIELLTKWANGRQLHFAKFFFWNSGFEMQKSQRGLLQSLLCQICCINPDLVTSICPDHQPNEPWSTDELRDAFGKLIDRTSSISAFCLFIDGLDEFDGEENDIIDIIRSLSRAQNVKICASSRPWNTFERAFNNLQRTLIVQRHTIEDMKMYVHGMLEEHIDFKKLSADDPRCLSLIPEIANRAHGVWLWVFFVVKDLIRDIEGMEGYGLLKQRLDTVPSKLEEYFERIMDRIENIHKGEAAQIFLITIEAAEPPPLYAFSLLDAERRNPDFALATDFNHPSTTELKNICDKWKVKMKSRCRDLLNVQSPVDSEKEYINGWRVEYLHRTVRDWLRDNHLGTLKRQAPGDFVPTISLCRITFALLRNFTDHLLGSGPAWDHYDMPQSEILVQLVVLFAHYARAAQELEKAETLFGNIEALGGIITRLIRVKENRWNPFVIPIDPHPNFLAMTINLGLTQYAQHILKMNPKNLKKPGCPLLSYAVKPGIIVSGWGVEVKDRNCRQIDLDLVKYLLSQGADPNQNLPNQPNVMSQCVKGSHERRNELSEADRETIFKAAKLLVEHGGRLQLGNSNPTVGRRHLLDEYLLSKQQVEELKAIAGKYAESKQQARWFLRSLLPWKLAGR